MGATKTIAVPLGEALRERGSCATTGAFDVGATAPQPTAMTEVEDSVGDGCGRTPTKESGGRFRRSGGVGEWGGTQADGKKETVGQCWGGPARAHQT